MFKTKLAKVILTCLVYGFLIYGLEKVYCLEGRRVVKVYRLEGRRLVYHLEYVRMLFKILFNIN